MDIFTNENYSKKRNWDVAQNFYIIISEWLILKQKPNLVSMEKIIEKFHNSKYWTKIGTAEEVRKIKIFRN